MKYNNCNLKALSMKRLFFAACVLSVFAFSAIAGAQPGTEIDPVVTRSYVDKKINEAIALLGGNPSNGGQTQAGQGAQGAQGSQAVFTPVLVGRNLTITGGEGCEMILRTGAGVIVTATDTVVNATAGADLGAGDPVPKGNLLIIPRGDGRGIKASEDSWLLVKGSYSIN